MPQTPQLTEDGSYTFFSLEYGETYHSRGGAKEEAEKKFVESCQIAEKARQQQQICLLDICYGLGYNSAAALATIERVNPHCQVHLIALEIDPEVPKRATEYHLLSPWGTSLLEVLDTLAQSHRVKTPNLTAHLYIGDARQLIQKVNLEGFLADAIFLDPFSPTKCPQLWTVEFLSLVAQCLSPTGIIATYSCAASVRTALKLAGLGIGATQAVGRRSPGTAASFQADYLLPISPQEEEHLQTRAAIPYRDPHLIDDPSQICQRRAEEQALSSLENTSQWKRRWQGKKV